LHDKIGSDIERAGAILDFFLFRIGYQRSAAEVEKFSFLVVTTAILTPQLFFRRGTLEFAMRNAFQHNGWEKILARTQYLVHDPHRHPQYMVFIVRLCCYLAFRQID